MPNNVIYFYLRSYIDKDVTGYTLTGDFYNASLAVDRDLTTFAGTNGLNTDGVNADFIIDMQWARVFDTLVIRSNFKTFQVKYSNDGVSYSDFSPVVSYTVNAAGFLLIPINSCTARYVKISAQNTIVSGQEKILTEAGITLAQGSLPVTTAKLSTAYQQVAIQNILGGSIQITKFPQSGKFSADLTINNLTGTDYATYAAIKALSRIDSFYALVYYSDDIAPLNSSALYLVNDIGGFTYDPATSTFSSGVNGKLSLREV